MFKLIKILFSTLTIYIFVLFSSAYLTLKYEQIDNNANIKTYYDSLWWSLNATSIGDSNVYPVTLKGRFIGAILILIGYGLFTVNVATISSLLNCIVNKRKEIKDKFLNIPLEELEKILFKGKNKNE